MCDKYSLALSNQGMHRKAGHRSLSRLDPAFSLIELLAVIAIILILLSLLLPGILHAQSRAQQIQCIHNVHQLGLGLEQFISDYHVYTMSMNAAFRKGGYPEHHADWIDALEDEGLSASKNSRFYERGVWRCPATSRPWNFPAEFPYGSYAYNVSGIKLPQDPEPLGLGGHSGRVGLGMTAPPVDETEVVQPSRMMAIGEPFTGGIEFLRYDLEFIRTKKASARHQGKAIVLFCDGHVESPSLKVLFSDTNDVALSRWNRDNQPHRGSLASWH